MNLTNICLICGGSSTLLFQAEVLCKYAVSYFKCERCGFIKTEEPYWLDEAYGAAISSMDVGLVSRNLLLANKTKQIIRTSFDCRGRFLDYAGGYGLFVRIMRDNGLDFYREDRHCANIFAQNLDLKDLGQDSQFELVTAFEVFEHWVDPVLEVEKLFNYADAVLFSTVLTPTNVCKVEDWWYFVPETGQHISFFSYKSLEILAKKLDCCFFSNQRDLHILAKRKLSNPFLDEKKSAFVRAAEKYLRWVLLPELPLQSLLSKDFEVARQRIHRVVSTRT